MNNGITWQRQMNSKVRESIGFGIGLILTTNNGTMDNVFLCCWRWNVCESNINIYMNVGMTRQRQMDGEDRGSIGFGISPTLTTNNGTMDYVFLCCWWWNVCEYCESNLNIYMNISIIWQCHMDSEFRNRIGFRNGLTLTFAHLRSVIVI